MSFIIYASNKNEPSGKSEVLVSEKDFELINRHNWHVRSNGYAYTTFGSKGVPMHDFVIGVKKGGSVVDHINRNKLDNRLENLRAVSMQQNLLNKGKMKPAKRKYLSPYVGVFHKRGKTKVAYEAGMSLKSRYFCLGRYDTEIEAALVRDAFAYKVHGEFAFLNFPNKVEEYSKWEFPENILNRYEKWK